MAEETKPYVSEINLWPKRRNIFLGILISSLIFVLPLLSTKIKAGRIISGVIVGIILLFVVTLLVFYISSERLRIPSFYDYFLLISACISAGHFIALFLLIPLKGDILIELLALAILSFFGSLYSALGIRLLSNAKALTLTLLSLGFLLILTLWILAEIALIPVWPNSTGQHIFFWDISEVSTRRYKPIYTGFAILEIIYWQLAYPALWIIAIVTKILEPQPEN